MKEKTRVNARKAALAVLKLLQEETDETRKIHIAEIVRRLKQQSQDGENIAANRDTVKRILDDLREFCPEVKCEETQRESGGESQPYTYGYWYEQPFAIRESEQPIGKLVKKNVKLIRPVLENNRSQSHWEETLDFQFNGYGSDGKPHPTSRPRITNILPLKICHAYNNFYLIGLFPEKSELSHFRLDLMTDVEVKKHPVKPDGSHSYARNRLATADMKQYISSHLYMFYERSTPPQSIVLRIRKWEDRPDGSLTFLYDAFGGNWKVRSEDDKTVEIQVKCLPEAIELFVWHYPDRIEKIVEPVGLWAQIQKNLREKYEKYFEK